MIKRLLSMVLVLSLSITPALAATDVTVNVVEGTCTHQQTHYTDNGDGTHSEHCSDCGETLTSGEHSDADDDGLCDKCGAPYTPACEHENTRYVDDENGYTHHQVCTDCDETILENEAHTSVVGIYCDKCGAQLRANAPSVLDVNVPVILPIKVDTLGNVTVPTEAAIENKSAWSVTVNNISVTPAEGWNILSMSEDFRLLPDNSTNVAVGFRADCTDADGMITPTEGNWDVAASESLPLNMSAKVPLFTEVGEVGTIASVTFGIGWSDPYNAPTSDSTVGEGSQDAINDQRYILTVAPVEYATFNKMSVFTSNRGQVTELPEVLVDDDHIFVKWQTVDGDDIELGTYVTGNTTIIAVIEEKPGYVVGPHYINITTMSTALSDLTGTITFVQEEPTMAGIDISEAGDDSIIAVIDGDNATVYSDQAYMAPVTKYMFRGYKAQNIDMSGVNASEVTETWYMFYNCRYMTEYTLPEFNKDNELVVFSLFEGCRSLPSNPDLSALEGITITNAEAMFMNCTSMETIDLSQLSLNGVENIHSMFQGCTNLQSIDMSGFTMDSVTDVQYLFSGCTNLSSIKLPDLSSRSVTQCRYMFAYCSNLETIDLSRFKTAPLEICSGMFTGCSKLKSVDVSGMDVSITKSFANFFTGCHSLTNENIHKWKADAVENIFMMFADCGSLNTISFGAMTLHGTDATMYDAFSNCTNLGTLDISNFDTSVVTSAKYALTGCTNLWMLRLRSPSDFDFLMANANPIRSYRSQGTMMQDGRTVYIYIRSD